MVEREFENRSIVCLTFDTDNCPELAIEFVQKRLERHGLAGTFFCTQRYESLSEPNEAATHPFLREFYKLDEMFKPLDKLIEQIPEAIGNRCHQLTSNGALYRHLAEKKFLYDSSWPMYMHNNIKPIRLHTGVLELPIFYAENLIIDQGMSESFLDGLRAPGLKVFLFHPVHIFHNSNKKTFYEIMKVPYPDRYVPELITQGGGVLTFFDALLEILEKKRFTVATCKTIALNENLS